MSLDESAVGRLLRVEEVIPAMERAYPTFRAARWCSRYGRCSLWPSTGDSSV